MRAAVVVVFLLSCSGEPSPVVLPESCLSSSECPAGYRCGADSRRRSERGTFTSDARWFGPQTEKCLPVCTDRADDACALPACSPWTPEEEEARAVSHGSPGASCGHSAPDCFSCNGKSAVIDLRWTCGHASGVATPIEVGNGGRVEGVPRPWNRYDVDPCPWFFPEPGATPEPWPFTF